MTVPTLRQRAGDFSDPHRLRQLITISTRYDAARPASPGVPRDPFPAT